MDLIVLPVSISCCVTYWCFTSYIVVFIFIHWSQTWLCSVHCPGRGTLSIGFLRSIQEMCCHCFYCFCLPAKTNSLRSVCFFSVQSVCGLGIACFAAGILACRIVYLAKPLFLNLSPLWYISSVHLCLNFLCKRESKTLPLHPRGRKKYWKLLKLQKGFYLSFIFQSPPTQQVHY